MIISNNVAAGSIVVLNSSQSRGCASCQKTSWREVKDLPQVRFMILMNNLPDVAPQSSFNNAHQTVHLMFILY